MSHIVFLGHKCLFSGINTMFSLVPFFLPTFSFWKLFWHSARLVERQLWRTRRERESLLTKSALNGHTLSVVNTHPFTHPGMRFLPARYLKWCVNTCLLIVAAWVGHTQTQVHTSMFLCLASFVDYGWFLGVEYYFLFFCWWITMLYLKHFLSLFIF